MSFFFQFTCYVLESKIRNCEMFFDVICNLSSPLRTDTSSVTKHPGECDVHLRLKDLVLSFYGCHSLVVFFGFFACFALICLFFFFFKKSLSLLIISNPG